MDPTPIKVTSLLLWKATLIFAVGDAALMLFLTHRIKPKSFPSLKWRLTIIAGLFWGLVWLLMSVFFWEPVYHYVFPLWTRWLIPPLYGILFAGVGLLLWWLSLRLPGHSVLNYFIFGGLVGSLTHLWAIHRGILNKPPLLQGVSSVSALVLPFFEFIFYWSIILGLASIGMKRNGEGL
jgi:hypothetical protein